MKSSSLIFLFFVLMGLATACAEVLPMDRTKAPEADEATVFLLHLDEGTGYLLKDSSKFNNESETMGKSTWVPGKFGKALSFDGEVKGINCGGGGRDYIPEWDFGETTDFTVEYWMKSESQKKTQAIINRVSPGFMMYLAHGKMEAVVTDSTGGSLKVFSRMKITDGEWHHIALVAERKGQITLYVDGEICAAESMKGIKDLNNKTRNLLIAYINTPDSFFEGVMDEIRISNVARKMKP